MTARKPFVSCRALIASAVLSAAAFAAAPPAGAETLQLSATAFVSRGVTSSDDDENAGMLLNATGQYYAAAPFPVGGMSVCRFNLVYRDNDADHNITARLLRKNLNLGGFAFDPPVIMAVAASSGADGNMRRASDATILSPVIATGAAFYYVELDIPFSALEIVGVQIVHKSVCP